MAPPPPGSGATPPAGGSLAGMLRDRPGVVAAVAGVVLLGIAACCLGGLVVLGDGDESDDGPTSASSPTSTSSVTTQPTSSSSSTTSPTESATSTPSTTSGKSSASESTASGSSAPSDTSASTESPESPESAESSASPESTTSEPVGTAEVDFPDSFDGWTKSDSATTTLAIYRKDEDALSAVAISGSQVDSYYERIWSDTSKHGDIVCGKLSTSANFQCAGAVGDGSGVLVSGSAETAEETATILAGLLAAI